LNGILDVGCGTGLVLSELISRFAWGIGIDISSKMIATARAKNLKAKFIVGDCFEISKLCPKAGAVLSRGVLLSHYGAQAGESLLRAAHDALLPGGFMLFDFLNETGRHKALHAPEYKHYFHRTAAQALARRAGFAHVTILGRGARRVLFLFGQRP
jgi:predicted TPR repeat methyltransferase